MEELPQDPTLFQNPPQNLNQNPTFPTTDLQIMAAVSHPLPSFSSFITVKLTQTNFPVWRTQVTPYLRAQGLFQYVDGSLLCPSPLQDGAPNPAYNTWIAKD